MNGTLGCADGYLVQFTTKDGKLIGETDLASSVSWNRKLDDYSSASVSFDLGAAVDSTSCCKLLDQLDVRRDYMSLYRLTGSDVSMVWTGPIQRIESKRDSATISAVDRLFLYQTRILRQNHDFTATDLATIWNAYLTDANSIDPIITDLCPPTGIFLDTQQDYLQAGMATDAMKTILDAGLDVTIHRGAIVYGGKELRLQRQALRDDHFVGDITVVQDASRIASQVYMKGFSDDFASYPGTPAAPSTGYYGLVERIFTDNNIVGVASLSEAAISHYNQLANQKPFFLDMSGSAALHQSAPVDINDLVAGTVFNVSIQDICPPMEQPLRMYEMNVEMSADENVSISLQPIGEVADV